MKFIDKLRMSWKTAAKVNATLVSALVVTLTILLAYGISQSSTHSINSAFVLYQGPCRPTRTINVILHAFVNVLGTLILSSSNFFMQISAAPSRAELDAAHRQRRWLDLGVPTARNLPLLARHKRVAWVVLLVSSVPIHLLINSVVFLVESQQDTFVMSLVAEPFLDGADYYLPGAALWNVNRPEHNCSTPHDMDIARSCAAPMGPGDLLVETGGVWDLDGQAVRCEIDAPEYLATETVVPSADSPCRDAEYTNLDAPWRGAIWVNCSDPDSLPRAQMCIDNVADEHWRQPSDRTMADYRDPSGAVARQIAKASAARQSGRWEKLEAEACWDLYYNCGGGFGLREFGDVVVVLSNITVWGESTLYGFDLDFDGAPEFAGWKGADLFPAMNERDMALWEEDVPRNKTNTLFYTSECQMTMEMKATKGNTCENTCGSHLSNYVSDPTTVTLDDSFRNPWTVSLVNFEDRMAYEATGRSGLANIVYEASDYRVSYCMAEVLGDVEGADDGSSTDTLTRRQNSSLSASSASRGLRSGECQINASNFILFIVTLCALAKAVQCGLLTWRLVWRQQQRKQECDGSERSRLGDDENPLITPGDAVDSLIRRPDPTTEGMCTLDCREVRKHHADYDETDWDDNHDDEPKPVTCWGMVRTYIPPVLLAFTTSRVSPTLLRSHGGRWRRYNDRYFAVMSVTSWVWTYTMYLTVIVSGVVFIVMATDRLSKPLMSGGFGPNSLNFFNPYSRNDNPSGNFLAFVVLANVPQLVISICYLRFNAIITRLQMAREWAAMCVAYKPLRVSTPRGSQVSTYTLQLPLLHAVPSIIISIIMHFFVANSLFVVVSDGGFLLGSDRVNEDMSIGISSKGFVGLGYSPKGILFSVIAFTVMAIWPLLQARRKKMGSGYSFEGSKDIIMVGTNSLSISAACHPSSLTKAGLDQRDKSRPGSNGSEMSQESDHSDTNSVSAHQPASARRASGAANTALALTPTAAGDEREYLMKVTESTAMRDGPPPGHVDGLWTPVLTPGRGSGRSSSGDYLAESLIRWGVVRMPDEFYNGPRPVDVPEGRTWGHLSFGVEKDMVETPEDLNWYI